MAYDDVINSDHEVCTGNSLQELMKTFALLTKHKEWYYFIRRVEL